MFSVYNDVKYINILKFSSTSSLDKKKIEMKFTFSFTDLALLCKVNTKNAV